MPYYRNSSSSYYKPSLFGGFKFFPPIIKALLISNVAVFILVKFFSLFQFQGIPVAAFINTWLPLYPIGDGFQVWQLVTYMFMHGGLMHLFFNMLALWMFGMELENDWGSRKFLLYYLLCGFAGGLSNLFVGPLFGSGGPTVGASGAIYGVLIAFGMLYPNRLVYYFLLPIPARYLVLMYIVLEIYAGVTGTPDGVAHFAHLGGAAVGFVYLLVDQRRVSLQQLWYRTKRRIIPYERVSDYSHYERGNISDANYYDMHDEENQISQQQVDEILDKINQHGYQSLSEEEKKILFEASKKLN